MGDPRLNCVDMSRWGGELTDQEARELLANGIKKIIVGTGHPNGAGTWARQQAESWLRNGGQHLDAYIYLYMAGNAEQQVAGALATMQGLPVGTWWLDAEDTESPELTPDQRARFLIECEIRLGERRTGIYTGRWWWNPNMGDTVVFGTPASRRPLWNSWYDGDPDTDGLPYGGWDDSEIEQYEGTTVLCGQSVDLNYDKTLGEEDEMSEEVRQLLATMQNQIRQLQDVIAGGPAGVQALWDDQGIIIKGLGEAQGDIAELKARPACH